MDKHKRNPGHLGAKITPRGSVSPMPRPGPGAILTTVSRERFKHVANRPLAGPRLKAWSKHHVCMAYVATQEPCHYLRPLDIEKRFQYVARAENAHSLPSSTTTTVLLVNGSNGLGLATLTALAPEEIDQLASEVADDLLEYES